MLSSFPITTFLFGMPGGTELILILVVILLFFGGKKIPDLMRGIGKGVREFNDAKETVKNEILSSNTPEELKEIYAKYPTLKNQIHPLIMDRKAIIDENTCQLIPENEIVQPLKNQENEFI